MLKDKDFYFLNKDSNPSNKIFIQVVGWERDVWRGFAMDILNKVTENHMTFRNAAGIN